MWSTRHLFAFFLGAVVGVSISLFAKFPETYGPEIFNATLLAAVLGWVVASGFRKSEESFALGASSHIANTTFDKYVEFADTYYKVLLEERLNLMRDGASPGALKSGFNLGEVRRRYALWLSKEINDQLKTFEEKLIRIGAKEKYLEREANHPLNRHRTTVSDAEKKAIEESHKEFGVVMGIGEDAGNELAIDSIVEMLRSALKIDELTGLRYELVERATAGRNRENK